MKTANPLLSVIIPSHGRSLSLVRAIESVLMVDPDCKVEVIVVPNGNDVSWRSAQSNFKADKRVVWCPIKKPNANAARNHGMAIASGKYLRFLDDDDYFYSDAVARQLKDIELKGVDVSSASINIIGGNSQVIRKWAPKDEYGDFSAFCFSNKRVSQVTSLVFLKKKINNIFWDESLPYSQDICWLIDICSNLELSWTVFDDVVGAWVHHTSNRISLKSPSNDRKKLVADRLIRAHSLLEKNYNLNEERRHAIASSLWNYAYAEFFKDLSYWWDVAKIAKKIYPSYSCNIIEALTPRVRFITLTCNPFLALPIVASIYYLVSIMRNK